jgi:MOSC domain-containing protein YiiM
MRVVSLNVGLPREIEWRGRTVLTSIYKAPVDRRLLVTTLNFEGDGQADLTVHGGRDKAVYVYPFEHYEFWRRELAQADVPIAAFGENLTTEGLLESEMRIGNRFRIGSAEFVVTQPRLPCFKLGIRFGRPDIVKRFLQSGRSGFYLAVTAPGEVGEGDSIELIARSDEGLTVADVVNLYTVDAENQDLLRRATQSSILPESWKDHFRKRLLELEASGSIRPTQLSDR